MKNNKAGHLTVQILLSVYRPNLVFLKEQLASLEAQTYENIELLIYDDCPASRTDISIFKKNLPTLPFRVLPYAEENVGYGQAFEKLIEASGADVLFFCDQDDIWLPEKVEKCVGRMLEDGSLAVVCDRSIIDGEGNVITPSVRAISKSGNETWKTGDDIAKFNLFVPYALGMSMCVDGRFARRSLPVSFYTAHDKWLLGCAATEGLVSYLDEPLTCYRRHGANVSGVLKGIEGKEDYYKSRPANHLGLVCDFSARYPGFSGEKEALSFARARVNKNARDLFRYRYLAPEIAWFEILLKFTPSFLFRFMVYVARKIKGN